MGASSALVSDIVGYERLAGAWRVTPWMSFVTALSGLVEDNIWPHDGRMNHFGQTKRNGVKKNIKSLRMCQTFDEKYFRSKHENL